MISTMPLLSFRSVLILVSFLFSCRRNFSGCQALSSPSPIDLIAKPRRASIVTGANGFLGRVIINELIRSSYQDQKAPLEQEKQGQKQKQHLIVCLVRPGRVPDESNYWEARVDESSFQTRVMAYDMLDGGTSLKEALQACGDDPNVDEICVYHVASIFGPTENHQQTALDNVKGTVDLVQTLVKHEKKTRLILTSSMAAVRGTGQIPKNGECYTFEDWNTLSKLGHNWGTSYQWAKGESERRAWEIANTSDPKLPMTSLCPSFIFGHSDDLTTSNSYSITLVNQWIRGDSPVQSRLCVDVRDVAKAQVAAGTLESAIGKRFIVSAERRLTAEETAAALKKASPNPEKIHFDTDFDGGAIKIGEQEVVATERLQAELGITLRPVAKTFQDMAEAVLRQRQDPPTR